MIICYKPETLGVRGKKSGKVVATSVAVVACDNCRKGWWTNTEGNIRVKTKKLAEAPKDYCVGCRNRLGIVGFLGHRHTKESKNKMGSKGDTNPSKRPEVRKKISERLKGRSPLWLIGRKRPNHSAKMKIILKEKWKDPEYRKMMAESSGRQPSRLHQDVKEAIIELGMTDFESEDVVGFYTVDEFSKSRKVIVEVNGDYWHANPKFYSPDDRISRKVGRTAQDMWNYDRRKIEFFNSLGYRVFVIWEYDWEQSTTAVMNKFTLWLNKDNGNGSSCI